MLAVQPQQFELPREEISMDSASENVPSMSIRSDMQSPKQKINRSILSPYKILLGLGLFFIVIMASYKIYSELAVSGPQSEINSMHGKIIQNADNSSKDKGSTTGSSTSKSSKNNDKPNTASQPASKLPISSNNVPTDTSSNGDDEDGDDQNNKNNGDRNKKILNLNRESDTKSKSSKSKYGTSTEEDSESVESEEDIEASNELIWPSNRQENSAPMIGSTRP